MRDIVYLDGQFVERQDARVSVEDRGYQFADGIYEVVRFHGRRAIRLDEHLARLERSAAHLRIENTMSPAEWHEVIQKLMDECGISDTDTEVRWLYQQVTRGDTARNHFFPTQPVRPTSVAYFRPVKLFSSEFRAQGVGLSTQPDERWERCFIKSVCLLPVVLAKQAALDAGAFEALLVRNGVVTEGGSTNIYCVINGALHTHPEGPHILSGITREMIFEAAGKAGVEIIERPVSIEEFRSATEAFISSTTLDIMPATMLDGNPIGNGKVGPVTQKLVETIENIIADEISQSPLNVPIS